MMVKFRPYGCYCLKGRDIQKKFKQTNKNNLYKNILKQNDDDNIFDKGQTGGAISCHHGH